MPCWPVDRVGERMERVRRAMSAGAADNEPLADNVSSGSKELRHAVRELKRAMEESGIAPATSSCAPPRFSSKRPRTSSEKFRVVDAHEGGVAAEQMYKCYSARRPPRPVR